MIPHPVPPAQSPSLASLLAQIEAAWTDERDADLPIRLAEEHPNLAPNLLDFFDDLVLGTVPPAASDDERAEASRRLIGRLRKTRQSALADAIERSQSLDYGEHDLSRTDPAPTAGGGSHLSLVSLPTPSPAQHPSADANSGGDASDCQSYYDYADLHGHGPAEIASAFELPMSITHILILNGSQCPPRAQREMARRGAEKLDGTDYETGLRLIAGHDAAPADQHQRAASRSTGFRGAGFSYVETIRNAPSGFPDEAQAYWLSLAEDHPSNS